jgi:dihydrofolate reductase
MRPVITAIMACDEAGTIGNGNSLPSWNCPDDLEHFRQTTAGHVMLMGRNTYRSMPKFYFVTRQALVLFIQPTPNNPKPNTAFFETLENMIAALPQDRKIFAIGGGEFIKLIFNENLVDRFILSRIQGEYEGDKKLPGCVLMALDNTWINEVEPDQRDGFTIYTKRNPLSEVLR